jgi:chromate reductase, NAD(P)H dehydrogenase (quinone)
MADPDPQAPPHRGPVRFLVFSASTRAESLNGRLARLAATAIEAGGGSVDLRPMSDFETPTYNADTQDADGFPPGADRLRECVQTNDAFVIASPEYNASMPGGLKNSLDWVSRFRPQPFNEKHGLLVSASPSMVGGNRGLWSLRVPFEHLGVRVYPDMFSLAQAHQAFDPEGQLANGQLQERFDATVVGFIDLVEASKHYPCAKTRWVEYLGEHPDPTIDRVE